MWRALHDAWWRLTSCERPASPLQAAALIALDSCAALYGPAVRLRNTLYDAAWVPPDRLPCRVLSIGNLTVGGTGKTSCVEWLVPKLQAAGRRVAILSRGYGGARQEPYWLRWELQGLRTGPAAGGLDERAADEPQWLARQLPGVPVVVGSRRAATGELAIRTFEADTLVLDDGFQHRMLHRDADIVLIDGRMPLGGWPVLPRGRMREPLSGVRRAQVAVITKADEVLDRIGALRERLQTLNPDLLVLTASHEPCRLSDAATGAIHPVEHVAGSRLGLVSSIGDPQGFERTLSRLHASAAWHARFPDHHVFGARDWREVLDKAAAQRPDALVTTEKDWIRLRSVVEAGELPLPLWILGVRLKIESNEALFDDRLARVLAG